MEDVYADNGPKTRTGKILKLIVIIAIIALYCVLFLRLFISCDSGLVKTMIFNRRIAADYNESILGIRFPLLSTENLDILTDDGFSAEPFLVYQYQPEITMDSDGRVQTRFITYLKNSRDLQVTVKMNTSYYDPGDNFSNYYYVLRKVSGMSVNEYNVGFYDSDGNSKYRFFRLDFENVTVNEGDQLSLILYHAEETPRKVVTIKLAGTASASIIGEETTKPGTTTTAISSEVTEDKNKTIFSEQLNTLDLNFKII